MAVVENVIGQLMLLNYLVDIEESKAGDKSC